MNRILRWRLATAAALLALSGSAGAQGFVIVGDTELIEDGSADEMRATAVPDGGYLVVWEQFVSGDIEGRFHDADGTPVGAVLMLNAITPDSSNHLAAPSAAVAPDGTAVAVWRARELAGEDGRGIRGRVISSAGSVVGAEFAVNEATLLDQVRPTVAARPMKPRAISFGLPTSTSSTVWVSRLR